MMKTGDLPSTNRGKCCLIFGVLMEIKLSGKRSVILKNNKPKKSSKYYRKCSNNFTAYCNNLIPLFHSHASIHIETRNLIELKNTLDPVSRTELKFWK